MQRPRALALAAAALLALVPPGCGSNGDSAVDEGVLARAAERMGRETSSRYEFEMEVDTKKDGDFGFSGGGTTNSDGSRGRLDGELTVDGEEFPVEMIVRGSVIYMATPRFEEVLPKGKRWVRLADDSAPAQTMTHEEFIEMLRASGDVEGGSAERIRGRQTTHYSAKVEMDELLDHAPEDARRKYEHLRGADFEMPIEAWIDEEGLLRRIEIDLERDGESVRMTADIVEYGTPVKADLPPAGQTVDEAAISG
ncbi:MAG: hypothetical protein M3389_09075 [Actinomycetota bacterium]|nr:hypothetical protein [Actinomycetota bacterium]